MQRHEPEAIAQRSQQLGVYQAGLIEMSAWRRCS
jgi:hypothetical protein